MAQAQQQIAQQQQAALQAQAVQAQQRWAAQQQQRQQQQQQQQLGPASSLGLGAVDPSLAGWRTAAAPAAEAAMPGVSAGLGGGDDPHGRFSGGAVGGGLGGGGQLGLNAARDLASSAERARMAQFGGAFGPPPAQPPNAAFQPAALQPVNAPRAAWNRGLA